MHRGDMRGIFPIIIKGWCNFTINVYFRKIIHSWILERQGVVMWIVRIALSRPYTFIVLALLLLILGPLTIQRTATDIFPSINIPVVSVVWSYSGLLPEEMSGRITSYKVQAANAKIGVARAAYFPDFNLSGGFGVESASLNNLFRGPSIIWGLGPTAISAFFNPGSQPLVIQNIFDGGRIRGLTDEAKARYLETVAQYKQTVLTAYQDVEDSLVAVRQLDKQRHTQSLASQAANRGYQQAMYRYKGGLTTYLDVVVIQNIALQTNLTAIQVNTRRQVASVQLIKALGGGWENPSNL